MNVVSIVLDTFRADIIGRGQKLSFVDTPNLDRLADQSIVFNNAYGEGQPTLQVRRNFFTGCRSFPFSYPTERRGHWHHAPGWHKIPDHQDTIAEILTNRGYCTGLISDVYHMFKPTMNYWRGFSSYEFIRGQETDNWKQGPPERIQEAIKRHTRDGDSRFPHAGLYQYLQNQHFREKEEDYQCARVFRCASEWLEENARNKPFFLWVEAFDPHEPWDPPTEYADKYCPNYDGIDFIIPGLAGSNASQEEIERTKALYYGEVTFLDKWVGQLLDKIETLNLEEDTIVLLLSDHGTQLMDHGAFGKNPNNLRGYNTGIVWQMRVPGYNARNIDALVQTHDVMPTLLDMLDIPFARAEGESVMPLVEGKKEPLRDPIVTGWAQFSQGNAKAFASVRSQQWNYITPVHNEPETPPVLFDLKNDPDENEDVSETNPETCNQFRSEVEALTGQPLPAILNEACDIGQAPGAVYLKNRPA